MVYDRFGNRPQKLSDQVQRFEAREEARQSQTERLRENCKISYETGLLDRFALAAMSALIRNIADSSEECAADAENVARHAYAIALAMMRVR